VAIVGRRGLAAFTESTVSAAQEDDRSQPPNRSRLGVCIAHSPAL